MTDPIGGDDLELDEHDEIAAVLLAEAVADTEADKADGDPAAPAPSTTQPDTGAHQPDMGDPLTQPAPPAPPAPQPPAQQPPAQQPPAPPAPPPAQQQPAQPTPPQPGQPPATGAANGPDGFPENMPVADMNLEQREAYWRKYARQHEDRVKAMSDYDELKATKEKYDALVSASQTDQERAVAEARRQGHAEAMQQAGGRLVEAYVRAAAAGRLDEQRVNALLEGLDRSRFLNQQTGEVAADRVTAFVHALAPAPQAPPATQDPAPPATGVAGQNPQAPTPPAPLSGGPDFGQGRQAGSRPAGIAAGREIARARFANTAAGQP